jgi:hypothetical protein
MKKRIAPFVISLALILFLTACESSTPAGFRTFGTYINFGESNKRIIAVIPVFGPGDTTIHFTSADGGQTWVEDKEYVSKNVVNNFYAPDCTESCKFKDWENEKIVYRITPGKNYSVLWMEVLDGRKNFRCLPGTRWRKIMSTINIPI